jgi:hypothetical protein
MEQTRPALKRYPTIGACGLDCGLCPRYYTAGNSRCPGCAGPDFPNKHPSCSFITCCVKKKGIEVCAQCSDFPCARFKSDEEYRQLKGSSSYPSNKKIMPNQRFIREYGIVRFIHQQEKRMRILESMLKEYDDGRSKSFFCKAAVLRDLENLSYCLDKAAHKIRAGKVKQGDVKKRAQILKGILVETALEEGVDLS